MPAAAARPPGNEKTAGINTTTAAKGSRGAASSAKAVVGKYLKVAYRYCLLCLRRMAGAIATSSTDTQGISRIEMRRMPTHGIIRSPGLRSQRMAILPPVLFHQQDQLLALQPFLRLNPINKGMCGSGDSNWGSIRS